MADSFKPAMPPNRTSKILKWYDTVRKYQETRALDTAINIAIAGFTAIIVFTIAAQFLVKRPVVSYSEPQNCTEAIGINDTHTKNRFLRKVKLGLEEACDKYNDVNIGTHVHINNRSAALNIFYLCDSDEFYENPVITKTGTNVGKCSESYNNVTKRKVRKFPVVLEDTRTKKSKTFYTLKGACAIHSAMERLKCTW